MITKNRNGFGWGSLLASILFFIASWIAFRSPVETLITLGLLYGSIAIAQGFIGVMLYFELKSVFKRNSWLILITGLFGLFIGFYLILNPTISLTFLPILFAVWFIVDSIRNILVAFRLQSVNKKWFWTYLTLGILGMILGIVLLSNLYAAIISVATLIAFYFFIVAIIRLIDAFV
ncbi:HdeD family acid-resistance protein [Carnobacterium mobile]|uniref:HdeD family acid-resistance protein n=1 Tax=Carnobacterium mobile TaxID=2750 RepID=UPI000552CC86|nr:DUF308 domain-containing protein [Carnobacterium mobile]